MNTIWIFQSNKELNSSLNQTISTHLSTFINQWDTHGIPLQSTVEIKYNYFIIVRLTNDSVPVSGCAMDRLQKEIEELENKYQLILRDPMQIAYKENNQIKIVSLANFKELVKNGTLSPKTPIFNNTIRDKDKFESQWEIPLEQSWAKTLLVANN